MRRFQPPNGLERAVFSDAYRERFDFRLRHAVRLRLRSDVPVGIAFAGGLDSSSVAMLAIEQLAGPFRGTAQDLHFLLRRQARYDQRKFAVKATGAQPHQLSARRGQDLGRGGAAGVVPGRAFRLPSTPSQVECYVLGARPLGFQELVRSSSKNWARSLSYPNGLSEIRNVPMIINEHLVVAWPSSTLWSPMCSIDTRG